MEGLQTEEQILVMIIPSWLCYNTTALYLASSSRLICHKTVRQRTTGVNLVESIASVIADTVQSQA